MTRPVTGQGERYFTVADAGTMFNPGVVTSNARRRRVWYEEHDPAAAVRIALTVARRSWIDAVTVVPAGVALAGAGLALAFGEHLYEVRRLRGLRGACVTSPVRPPLPRARLCRLPHLVTVEGRDGAWRDVAVWEVMHADRFQTWLGRDSADLKTVEQWLPHLLRLRGAVRARELPDCGAVRALYALLETRYLSLRLVLENPHLFETLLTKETR
ncbi:hypothetical protein ACFQVD_12775 [Streptosporangium amethystogenes subsp. fukuiense]|uniref:Uncharacterized protein n=1 Tax=Streptosporangium amethystogenes subsp. fukuiense TaxID=698418 RepID=A0ABW2SZ57_9ACTN